MNLLDRLLAFLANLGIGHTSQTKRLAHLFEPGLPVARNRTGTHKQNRRKALKRQDRRKALKKR